jgi:hypothetical protein
MTNSHKRGHLAIALLFFGAFLLTSFLGEIPANGQTGSEEARVTSVSGIAKISRGGQSGSRLLQNTVLTPGDEIDTTGGGRVVIDLSDGSQVVILPGSRVVLADYQNAASFRELLQILLGRIQVRINHFKGKPNPYRVTSPTASIAVRGTVFEVSVTLGETRVTVTEGSVEVASLRDPQHPLLAEPGHGVVVRPDFTLDTFLSALTTNGTDEPEKPKERNSGNRGYRDNDGAFQSADRVYERAIEKVVESGELILPSRFTALPDAYLDSLENPAYATVFSKAEGRVDILPSINGIAVLGEDVGDRLGLKGRRPIDYDFVPQGSLFVPINRFNTVVGGSFGYARNASQSLVADENFLLSSPPFPQESVGLRTGTGITTNDLLDGTILAARRFSNSLSVGFSLEHLVSTGYLNEVTSQIDSSGLSLREQVSSRSFVDRTRFTLGVKYDFRKVRMGAFYRYTSSSGTDRDRFRLINGVPETNDLVRSVGRSSEIGFRLRGAFSSHLYYGLESNLFIGGTLENQHRSVIVDSIERDPTTRASLGVGIAYLTRNHTVFSFDTAGGIIQGNQNRFEVLTGNLLESERFHDHFLSLHFAVQRQLWGNLFVGASILSVVRSRSTDSNLFPDSFGRVVNSDGIFIANGNYRDLSTGFYSGYGIGWRFRPNVDLQYVLTTDYGQTNFRHVFLLRYSFGLKRE